MKQEIEIHDADRQVDYTLECDYVFHPFSRGCGPNHFYGPSPDEPAFVEINSVRCIEVFTWLGDHATIGFPGREQEEGLERTMGEWCLERYEDQIEEALLAIHEARAER